MRLFLTDSLGRSLAPPRGRRLPDHSAQRLAPHVRLLLRLDLLLLPRHLPLPPGRLFAPELHPHRHLRLALLLRHPRRRRHLVRHVGHHAPQHPRRRRRPQGRGHHRHQDDRLRLGRGRVRAVGRLRPAVPDVLRDVAARHQDGPPGRAPPAPGEGH